MLVKDLAQQKGFKTITMPDPNERIVDAYTGDLLSDVMGNAPSESVLITIQAHKNSVAVASLAGIKALVICNGRSIPDDMVPAAEEEGIALFSTTDSQFRTSCRLGNLLESDDAHTP